MNLHQKVYYYNKYIVLFDGMQDFAITIYLCQHGPFAILQQSIFSVE